VLPRGVVPGVADWLQRRRTKAAISSADERETTVPGSVAGAAR
jgi:hypothetical protein